jgi:hypothetical protein
LPTPSETFEALANLSFKEVLDSLIEKYNPKPIPAKMIKVAKNPTKELPSALFFFGGGNFTSFFPN